MQQLTKKRPERMCLSCRSSKDKRELIRIVRTPEGTVEMDPGGKRNGRGAYLCRDRGCFEKAFRTKALGRALNCEVPPEVYERIREEVARVE